MPQLHVRPQGFFGRLADGAMFPVMCMLQGFVLTLPQRTHRWNNTKFYNGELDALDPHLMVTSQGDARAYGDRWTGTCKCVPIFHIPILKGGWREYVVLEPKFSSVSEWYVGWIAGDVRGVSRIPLTGQVKVLRGPKPAQFFGIHAKTGMQVPISMAGEGRVGDGKHRFVPFR